MQEVAFEISVNGEPLLEPMECPGMGSLMATLSFWRGSLQTGVISESIHFHRSGHMSGQDTPLFSMMELSVGDEITIRIVDRQSPELPPSRQLFSN